jgi:hypothetical protein
VYVVSRLGATTVLMVGSTSRAMLTISFAGKRATVSPTLSGGRPYR